jgi:Family of unknown function (DUF5767)
MSGGITIHEMESVAQSMDGGVINIASDPNDSLGFNLLSNSGGRSSGSSKQISFDINNGPMNGGISEIEIGSTEPLEPISFNLGGGPAGPAAPVEIQFTRAGSSSTPPPSDGNLFSNSQTASGPFTSLAPAQKPGLSPEEEKKEKIDLLNKLQRFEQKGLPVNRRYTMDNTLEEIKTEYSRLADARNLESSLRFQRQAMMSVVTGLQWMNDKFDPFELKLDGWSESVHENLEDFDEIFEELYDKYKERGKMPPEARLVMALAGSGFMCHVSNTFLRSRMPSMDDILRQNPEMARQFATAAAKQAGPGFGNFMSMAMNGGEPAPAQQQQQAAGAFFGSSAQQQGAPPMAQMPQSIAAMEQRQTARREMKGPSGSGVDDILRTFEEVRRNEVIDGIAPSSIGGDSQPAVQAAVEIQSMGSDDIGSMAGSTAGRRRGGSRRVPIGNSVAINV